MTFLKWLTERAVDIFKDKIGGWLIAAATLVGATVWSLLSTRAAPSLWVCALIIVGATCAEIALISLVRYLYSQAPYTVDQRKFDETQLNTLFEILPMNGSIRFLREGGYWEPFRLEILDDVYNFQEKCIHDSSFKFISSTLEHSRLALKKQVAHVLSTLSRHGGPMQGDQRFMEIARTERSETSSGRFDTLRQKIDEDTLELVTMYDALVDQARHEYLIVPVPPKRL